MKESSVSMVVHASHWRVAIFSACAMIIITVHSVRKGLTPAYLNLAKMAVLVKHQKITHISVPAYQNTPEMTAKC